MPTANGDFHQPAAYGLFVDWRHCTGTGFVPLLDLWHGAGRKLPAPILDCVHRQRLPGGRPGGGHGLCGLVLWLRSPDRVVKSRLLRWIIRGPVTAVITLGITTVVRRAGEVMGSPYTAWVPIVMVTTVVLLEYLITLVGPLVQRWLFYGNDSADLELIQTMEDRLLTRNDLIQFLEMILASGL